MKRIIILALVSLITLGVSAQQNQTASKGEQTVTIQTNGVCQKCADKFKENVPYFKGVKAYAYDMRTAKLTITYDTKKTNPDQLRQEISKLGYNADDVKADPAARAKLPACCRVEKGCGGCPGHNGGQGCGNHGGQKSCAGHAENGGHNCGNHSGEKSCAGHEENGGPSSDSARPDGNAKQRGHDAVNFAKNQPVDPYHVDQPRSQSHDQDREALKAAARAEREDGKNQPEDGEKADK